MNLRFSSAIRTWALCLVGLLPLATQAEDWRRFRGPDGAATSEERGLPVKWSATENVAWKVELPGHGASSPIVVGDKIYLTCYSGYGLSRENPGKDEDLTRHVMCFARSDGKLLWKRDFKAVQPEAGFESFLRVHGYSSHTPTSDGDVLYAFLGKSGVFALDLDGKKQLWRADVGWGFSGWGSAASPVVYGDLLLVNASLEKRSLYALNKKTGEEVWRVKKVNSSWCTPILVEAPGGKTELVLYIHLRIAGFDPASGEELWTVDTDENSSYAAPCPVAAKGIVYAYAGGGNLLAIRAGGRGNVTKTHVKWQAPGVASGITSPLLYGDYVYCVGHRDGVIACVKAADGEIAYKRRLSGGASPYASPVGADGKVYVVSRQRGTFVLAAGPKYDLLAHNVLSPDDSTFNASPAVHNGQLILRSNRFLYCIGQRTAER